MVGALGKMGITSIKATNFRSFRQLDIKLEQLNIVIGANASGKSNLVQLLGFLRDIANFGLDNAISMQGGSEFVRNLSSDRSAPVMIEIQASEPKRLYLGEQPSGETLEFRGADLQYKFSIVFRKRGDKFQVVHDEIEILGTFYSRRFVGRSKSNGSRRKAPYFRRRRLATGKICFRVEKGFLRPSVESDPALSIDQTRLIAELFGEPLKIEGNTLLMQRTSQFAPRFARDLAIFDFDPKLPKHATPITGKVTLEEDGSNLALALRRVTRAAKDRREFMGLIRSLLPFVHKVSVDRLADKSMLVKIRESYYPHQYVPASLVSDGTINLTAIVMALFFEGRSITVIEEPERNIHPHLMARLMQMMRDASKVRQVIVTTHNPEFIKHSDLKDILFVSRGKDGSTSVTRLTNRADVSTFLQNEIGLDQLFVSEML